MSKKPILLYHWSPSSRRKGIERFGLVPGKISVDKQWKPPYICFSDSPSQAWGLSGGMNGHLHSSWDLWMVWSNFLVPGYEVLFFDNGEPKEYRAYSRIYKRDIWYVGTREVK